MRIAILGAGFAGLATAFHLLHRSQGSVTLDLFDPLPIGKGISGHSSGLLHPFSGKYGKGIPGEKEKIEYAHRLITEASSGLGERVVLSRGILRPAVSQDEIEAYMECHKAHTKDCEWWPLEKCKEKIPGLNSGALYIKSGITVDPEAYLHGLWQTVGRLGTTFHPLALKGDEKNLSRYDVIIYAMGAASKHIEELKNLPLNSVKGQIVTFEWPENLESLPMSLMGPGYLVMSKDRKKVLAGATFENNFSHPFPDLDFALAEIRKKIAPFFPKINEMKPLDCYAGIRATSSRKLPLVGKVSQNKWVITGLGGKGLIYHGYLGYLLAGAILQDDSSLIPKEYWPL